MSFTFGKIDVEKAFKKTIDAMLNGVKQAVIQEASQTKAVQQEIESQKTVAGKNILWKYFPYAILACVGIVVLAKVR